jgi:hypothetical protein
LAAPAKLIVILAFMTQFVAILLGLGVLLPYLHERGISWLLLTIGAAAAFGLFQVGLGFVLRHIPVRCLRCRGQARFAGFGWWPFIYRFNCEQCGIQRRIEVGGR